MVAVARGAALGASSPLLAEWIVDARGFLTAPDSLSFTVYDVSTDELDLAPAVVHGPHAVNLTADRVQDGLYAAAWSVGANEALGRHRIAWSATITTDYPDGTSATRTLTWTHDFDVLAAGVQSGGYALVSDLRAEGVRADRVSDARLLKVIREAETYVERFTGRWFEPRHSTWTLDGPAKPALMVEHPIVGIESATVYGEGAISTDLFRVYNRHLAGMRAPDDRNNPKLEFFVAAPGLQGPVQPLAYPYPLSDAWLQPKVWARGSQNVTVAGVFGFTDPDESPSGCTPSLITKAVKLLAMRSLPRMSDASARFDARNQYRLRSERTREQSYELGPGREGTGSFTGDPEVDDILETYSRPPRVAVV